MRHGVERFLVLGLSVLAACGGVRPPSSQGGGGLPAAGDPAPSASAEARGAAVRVTVECSTFTEPVAEGG